MLSKLYRQYPVVKDKVDPKDILYKAEVPVPAGITSVDLRAFCGPVKDQGQSSACHDADTEVLTSKGWKFFENLTFEDQLATVNPITSKLTYENPTNLIAYHYEGQLVTAERMGLNFKLTPNHNMLVRKWSEKDRTLSSNYSLVSAENLGWYSGLMNKVIWEGTKSLSDTYTLKGIDGAHLKKHRVSKKVCTESWLKFLGIYLAEGTMLARDERKKPSKGREKVPVSYKIQLAAVKEREKEFIRPLLKDLGVNALELADRFTFSDRQIYETLSSYGLEGVKAVYKFIPDFVFDLPAKEISWVLEGHVNGDGSKEVFHFTSSKKLADDLQRLIFLSGSEAHLKNTGIQKPSILKDGRTIISKHEAFVISNCKKKNLSIEKNKDLKLENYNGPVYCAEVPTNHTLVTRREGCILISGNCTAHAAASMREFLYRKYYDQEKDKSVPKEQFILSPLYLYYKEREFDGDCSQDAGSSMRTAAKMLNNVGTTLSVLDEFSVNNIFKVPTDAQIQAALTYRSGAYHKINTLEDMKSVLASGYTFIAGITVYESFEDDYTSRTGWVLMPDVYKEKCYGGHATHVVGFDDTKHVLICQNSWGPEWGDKGFYYLPYQFVSNIDLFSDAWVNHLGPKWIPKEAEININNKTLEVKDAKSSEQSSVSSSSEENVGESNLSREDAASKPEDREETSPGN